MKNRIAVVLAAGKGTRMNSDLPKVLVPVLGKPMIRYVLEALAKVHVDEVILVVGHKAELVKQELSDQKNLQFVEQTEQLGTGHAVMVCQDALKEHDGSVVVLAGDCPLAQADSLQGLLDEFEEKKQACLLGTLEKDNPFGLGRIIRNEAGQFTGIIEEKDATEEQKAIKEVNMSVYVFENKELLSALQSLTNENKQQEYYLTDCPGILVSQGKNVEALSVLKPCEALSINTVDELKIVEDAMRELGYTDATS